VLDESHCSVHTYADHGLMALDVFTCGSTDPRDVLKYIHEEIDLGDTTVKEVGRFTVEEERTPDNLLPLAARAAGVWG
jgi:S-adenosylmethionine decarboxylase